MNLFKEASQSLPNLICGIPQQQLSTMTPEHGGVVEVFINALEDFLNQTPGP